MKNERPEKIKSSEAINTVGGRGTHIVGPVNIKNSGRIDGFVEGGITSDQDIVVGEGGVVKGEIVSRIVIIGGKVLGSVKASKRVVLEKNAELHGDIHTEQLKISDGARFNGNCHMLQKNEKII